MPWRSGFVVVMFAKNPRTYHEPSVMHPVDQRIIPRSATLTRPVGNKREQAWFPIFGNPCIAILKHYRGRIGACPLSYRTRDIANIQTCLLVLHSQNLPAWTHPKHGQKSSRRAGRRQQGTSELSSRQVSRYKAHTNDPKGPTRWVLRWSFWDCQ